MFNFAAVWLRERKHLIIFRPVKHRISLEIIYLTLTPEFVSLHVKNAENDILFRALAEFVTFFFFSLLTID